MVTEKIIDFGIASLNQESAHFILIVALLASIAFAMYQVGIWGAKLVQDRLQKADERDSKFIETFEEMKRALIDLGAKHNNFENIVKVKVDTFETVTRIEDTAKKIESKVDVLSLHLQSMIQKT